MIAAGEPAPDFTLRDQDGEAGLAGGLPRPQGAAGLLPGGLQPGLRRSVLDLPGGEAGDRRARASSWSGSASTASSPTRPSRRSSGSTPPCSPTSSPRARSRAPTAPTSRAWGSPTAPSSSSTRRAWSPGPTNRPTRASSPAPTSSSTRSAYLTDLSSAEVPPIGPGDHVRGEGEGLIVYADLGCPHCAAAWVEIASAPEPDRLPPLPGRQQAPALAGAARGGGGRRDAGPVLRDGRLALRRPRPGRRPAPLGAGRAARARPRALRGRPPLAEAAARVRRDFRVRDPGWGHDSTPAVYSPR